MEDPGGAKSTIEELVEEDTVPTHSRPQRRDGLGGAKAHVNEEELLNRANYHIPHEPPAELSTAKPAKLSTKLPAKKPKAKIKRSAVMSHNMLKLARILLRAGWTILITM